MPKPAAQPGTQLFAAFSALTRWEPSYIVLVNSGVPHSLPRLLFIAGWFWAIILSQAV